MVNRGLLKDCKRTDDRKTESCPVGLVVWRLLVTLMRALWVIRWSRSQIEVD